ncbi:MAG: histidine kinase [Bacteroidetes bacterium]|nr:histidine kinase [Bacteroidota bacterium]
MRKPVIILLHVGYWLMFFLLLALMLGLLLPTFTEMRGPGPHDLGKIARQWFTLMLGMMIVPGVLGFYINYFLLFNRLVKKRRWWLLLAVKIAVAAVCGLTGLGIMFLLKISIMNNQPISGLLFIILLISFEALISGIIGLVMRGFIGWFDEFKRNEEQQRRNTEMELALIRAQLNPHFLFNTINNIDVLINKEPETASAYLNQLSGILRYLLYESPQELTPLDNELKHLENYIALQRIRSANPQFIHCVVTGSTAGLRIAPMVLLPFVENAFKYATNKKQNEAVRIEIDITNRQLSFRCSNFIDTQRPAESNGGLGNKLISRRLELLYPHTHTLHIAQTGTQYTVHLQLTLTGA